MIKSNIATQLGVLTFSRVLINTAVRMIYPFLPAFARALHVDVESLVFLISGRSALTICAPLFGGLSDRYSSHNILYASLGIYLIAMLIVVIMPGFTSFVAAILLVTLCKVIFDPAAYSFLSERIPYAKRGFYVGIYELSWSGSFFIGMPAIGWLMALQYSDAWQFPFITLGILAILSLFLNRLVIPRRSSDAKPAGSIRQLSKWKQILSDVNVMAALAAGALLCLAQESVLVIMGIWLEKDFGLTLTALGFSSIIIGIAELIAEGGVIGLIDRMGKRRTIIGGTVLGIIAFAIFPFISESVTGALIALFLIFFAFEFSFVATLPFVTELVPDARAQVMSLYIALQWSGRAVGALAGGWLFQFGLIWNGIFGAGLNILVLILLIFLVREHGDHMTENR